VEDFKKVIVVGSGGHAKVVIDILQEMIANESKIEIIGVTSNLLAIAEVFFGFKVLGTDEIIKNYSNNDNYMVAMGLGGYRDNTLRDKIFHYVKDFGINFINAIHPSAIISKSVKLGEGVVIFPGVVINTDVMIGDNSIIATLASIDHETIIENNVLVSAGVTVGAYAKIGSGTLLALGSKVISGVTIGRNVLVASGAVVVSNIDDNKTVFGIPAKERKIEL
jgi:sugar O-acyltransferase (sialic acid O-acetyltransferase NeuD family)